MLLYKFAVVWKFKDSACSELQTNSLLTYYGSQEVIFPCESRVIPVSSQEIGWKQMTQFPA
jgi:hypothetical protein